MGQHRTAWHLLAATFLDEYRPRDVQLETEVQLSKRPQHVDMLLLRKGKGSVDDARAFFRMWHLMGPVALVEYKSRSRPARPGVFHQLFGYAHQYARSRQPEQPASQLSLFLLVPTVTPTIVNDAALLGLELGRSEDAYIPVMGALFPTWVVPLNTLAEQEDEPLIGELGSRTVDSEDRASLRWLAHFYMANENRVQNLEGFEELKADFMKSESFREMVAGMSAEQIAQTLTPEQRYAVLLAMSDEELCELPNSFVEALPESIRAEIRRRLAH
ncbi:MAG: hypothetical protein AAFY60_04980 [Myxococcota bacterium]